MFMRMSDSNLVAALKLFVCASVAE